MQIENKTIYDTRYLRRLFIACEKHEGTDSRHRRVTIKYHRRQDGLAHGYAWLNSCSVVMTMPHPGNLNNRYPVCTPSAHRVAKIYIHEVGHNMNLNHKEMDNLYSFAIDFWPDEQIPVKQIAAKPKPNIIEVRAGRAQVKLGKWIARERRAAKAVKKYRRQVNYYQTKMAACQKDK